MNRKVILTGKAILATIMATSMSFNVVSSLPIMAEEKTDVSEESTVLEDGKTTDVAKDEEIFVETEEENLEEIEKKEESAKEIKELEDPDEVNPEVLSDSEITELGLTENNKKLVYLPLGEQMQLTVQDQNGETVDPSLLNFELNTKNGFISVDENGLIEALKQSTKTRDLTQVTVSLKTNPDIYTYVQVVVPVTTYFDEIVIAGSNGYENSSFINFESGGAVSDNGGHKYGFKINGEKAEWDYVAGAPQYDNQKKYYIEYYLDGELQGTEYPLWNNVTHHDQGLKDDDMFTVTIEGYGTHTVTAKLISNDGTTYEKSIEFTNIPVYFTAPNVTKVNKDAGDVEIPSKLNGNTVTGLKVKSATDGVQSGVTSIVVPETVTSIDSTFFSKATDLKKIVFTGTVPEGSLDLTNVPLEIGSISVPESQQDLYLKKAKESWKKDTTLTWEAIFGLDIVAPTANITYSTLDPTNGDVVATLTSSEEIGDIVGWDTTDHIHFTKTYSDNVEETISFTDLAGNTGSVEVKITNIDKIAPVIEANDITLVQGDQFDPLDFVNVTDNFSGKLIVEVLENTVLPNVPGEYVVTYYAEDEAGNFIDKTIKVIVNPKIIELNSIPTIEAKDKTITVGEEFNREIALKGVSAYDKEDGDLTDKIEVESTVDRHKVGEYTVTYTVSDTQGATATKTIKVTVKAKEENKEESKKEEKEDKVKTSVSVSTGLFAGMTGISALGMGILETLKRRKK